MKRCEIDPVSDGGIFSMVSGEEQIGAAPTAISAQDVSNGRDALGSQNRRGQFR
jgi:hypothetical protein